MTLKECWKNLHDAAATSGDDYVWTLHCVIACNILDELPEISENQHKIANLAASRIMKQVFNFDMNTNNFYIDTMKRHDN